MKSNVVLALVSAMVLLAAGNVQAGDKKREAKKGEPAKKADAKPAIKAEAKTAPKREPRKVDPKRAAEFKKKQEAFAKKRAEESAKRAADAKKRDEERAKQLAEAKKKYEEEQKKRAAASALNRRRSQLPRLVQDLVDERQISQIEALQKRLKDVLESKYAEQKKLYERGNELRKEITELREKFDQDVAKALNSDQQKQLAKRRAEIEAKQKAYLAKREAERKEAYKKRETENKKK